jgi:sulfur relay (sulfurtransferase) complex TusBCD TusD component (DsrE family)
MSRSGEENRKLGFMLTTSAESENTRTVIKLTEAALEEGLEVSIFLMCDGVYNMDVEPFTALAEKGARLTLCAHNADERKLEKKGPILFGSQYDLAEIVAGSDRFLAFN